MESFFSLWDTGSGNFVDDFISGAEALALAARLIAAYGDEYAEDLEMSWTSANDETRVIARGPALAALAASVSDSRVTAATGE